MSNDERNRKNKSFTYISDSNSDDNNEATENLAKPVMEKDVVQDKNKKTPPENNNNTKDQQKPPVWEGYFKVMWKAFKIIWEGFKVICVCFKIIWMGFKVIW